jgi:hypothetical protein
MPSYLLVILAVLIRRLVANHVGLLQYRACVGGGAAARVASYRVAVRFCAEEKSRRPWLPPRPRLRGS